MQVACALLASGFGRRFGENKLLAAVEGAPLYRRAMAALSPAPFARRVAVSQYPAVLADAPRYRFAPVWNAGAAEGIAASVRLGAAAAEGLDGVLFAVCDQPFLTTNSIVKLLKSFEESPQRIHALRWRGRRGNPVVFPAACLPDLRRLRGDVGGGQLIRRHPELLVLVEAASPRELADVDRPEDLSPPPPR